MMQLHKCLEGRSCWELGTPLRHTVRLLPVQRTRVQQERRRRLQLCCLAVCVWLLPGGCLQLHQVSQHGRQAGDADAASHKQGRPPRAAGCHGEGAADLDVHLSQEGGWGCRGTHSAWERS